ncbi:MAG: DsrE/DsrF/DrsH-like family protein [Myxococcales bacterium]|nr:DsrE/DsrF/DrsH-like family protein [Myxococcales bacterium]
MTAMVPAPALTPQVVLDRITCLENELAALKQAERECSNRLSLVAFSGELDPLLAAMNLATGSASMGMEVDVFFSFWAVGALRAGAQRERSLIERVLGLFLPRGAGAIPMSRFNFGGVGTAMVRRRMKKLGQPGLPELIAMAKELGVTFHVCEASLGMFGMTMADLADYPGLAACGVAGFMERASRSRTTLFI